jgi:flagellar L-ring protein FlgH
MKRKLNLQRHSWLTLFLVLMLPLASSSALQAQFSFLKRKSKPSQLQSSLNDYLTRVRVQSGVDQRTTGSLWSPSSLLGVSESDYKARHVGDLLIIRIVDNFSATTNGSEQAQRTFSATSGLSSGVIRNPVTGNSLQNLFSPSSSENLNGKGQTALSSTVSLNLAGRVVEELPNGVLVIEAVRDLTLGNDRQTIVIHGLVRPMDIASDNSVSSSSIASLEAEVRGKGVVADSIRQPNVVIRTLLKILDF